MKLLKMIVKEIKLSSIRDTQGLIMMMVFPLILTLVLGFALSGMYEGTGVPTKIDALYCVEDDTPLGHEFTSGFLPESERLNISLTEETDVEKAKEAVRNGSVPSFIHISEGKILVYEQEGGSFNASITYTILNGFAKKYDAYRTVLSIKLGLLNNPEFLQVDSEPAAYTRSVSLDRSRTPRAIDYYAITMMTLITMYGAHYGLGAIAEERRYKTLYRVFAAPVGNAHILVSKVIGVILAIVGQIGFVFLVDKIVLNTYWGDNLLPLFAIILSQIVMVVGIGVGIGYIFKNSDTGTALIQTTIPILVFLGGGYVDLDIIGIGGFFEKLTNISPLRWINKTMLQIIYANDYTNFAPTIAICLGIAAVFLALSAAISRRELKV
jgi:ABC-2 type transport system permease protein